MEKKKRKTKDERRHMSRTMEVLYQREFKRADKAFQRTKSE